MVQTVTSFTHTYTTDLPAESIGTPSQSQSGILHSTRPSSNNTTEASIFAWIDDQPSLDAAIHHLTSDGFGSNNDSNSLLFIPYSSKESWVANYPHAKVTLDAKDGKLTYSCAVSLNTDDHPNAATKTRLRKKKRKSKSSSSKSTNNNNVGLESHPAATLSNSQRDALHIEMYLYLSNLRTMLREMENTKRRLGNVCATSDKVGVLMDCFGGTFGKVIECNVPGNTVTDDNGSSNGSGMNNYHGEEEMNLLESMGDELEERLANKTIKGQSHSRAAGLTFEEYYERLMGFKEEHGHVNVPIRYKDKNLANWVHDVRRNKKDLDKAAETNEPPPKKSKQSQYIRPSALTPERIAQLESINFAWGVRNVPNHVSWEDRFKQLMEYYEAYGAWPPHSLSGGLGSWVKHQRRRWATNDKAFMEKYYPRLEEVGFIWRVKGSRNSDASGHLMQNVDLQTDQNFQHEEEHTMYHHHQDEEHNIDADDAHGVYNEMVVGDEDVQHSTPEITEV